MKNIFTKKQNSKISDNARSHRISEMTIEKKGFTLIETLFAVLIFSAALISLMTIAGRGIGATKTAREQITAYYLAQEGLEIVRNMRDANFLVQAPWDTGFTACVASTCQVVYGGGTTAPAVAPCSGQCPVFAQNGAFLDTGIDSGYRRTIALDATQSGEYLVRARVTWTAHNVPRTVELSTIIKQWQ